MSTPAPAPTIPGVDRDALIEAINRDTTVGSWLTGHTADVVLAHIAAHHECACTTCGAKYDKCPECAADDAYEKGRMDACDREHADEWVEVDEAVWDDLPVGARSLRKWVVGVFDGGRCFVHRDDLPDTDPRALIARELGPAKADTFLGLLDEHGWTVTRKEER